MVMTMAMAMAMPLPFHSGNNDGVAAAAAMEAAAAAVAAAAAAVVALATIMVVARLMAVVAIVMADARGVCDNDGGDLGRVATMVCNKIKISIMGVTLDKSINALLLVFVARRCFVSSLFCLFIIWHSKV